MAISSLICCRYLFSPFCLCVSALRKYATPSLMTISMAVNDDLKFFFLPLNQFTKMYESLSIGKLMTSRFQDSQFLTK